MRSSMRFVLGLLLLLPLLCPMAAQRCESDVPERETADEESLETFAIVFAIAAILCIGVILGTIAVKL